MPAPAEVLPFATYDFELVAGTGRDATKAAEELNAWRTGKGELYSTGTAVATIQPRQEELGAAFAALAEAKRGLGIIAVPGLPFVDHERYLEGWELLAPEIKIVAGGLAATLQNVVDADIARSTAKMRRPIGNGQVRVARATNDHEEWHADNLPETDQECVFEAGMQRYGVTLGVLGPNGESPSTDFREGVVLSRKIVGSFMHQSPFIGEARTVTHPIGTVVRFDGRFGMHRIPATYGPRIFATTSALEIAARRIFANESLD